MTPFERLTRRMQGESVDKLPNMNILMAVIAKEAGVSYSEYARDYRKLVEGNLICVEKYGIDAVSAISDPMRETAAFGGGVVFPENAVPYCPEPLLKDGCDVSRLKIVSPYDNERTLDRIRAVELFKDKVGGQIPVIGWVEGVLAECADLRGVSELMIDLVEEEEGLEELMEIVSEQQRRFIKAQVEAGADIIGIGNAVASLIGPSLYEAFSFDYEKAAIDYVHSLGAKVKLHICGDITPLLPQLKMLGPDILDFDWMVDCKNATEIMKGSAICLCGNIDPVGVMLEGGPDDVRKAARNCMEQGDERLLLACGCEVPVGTPPENLKAMNDSLRIPM